MKTSGIEMRLCLIPATTSNLSDIVCLSFESFDIGRKRWIISLSLSHSVEILSTEGRYIFLFCNIKGLFCSSLKDRFFDGIFLRLGRAVDFKIRIGKLLMDLFVSVHRRTHFALLYVPVFSVDSKHRLYVYTNKYLRVTGSRKGYVVGDVVRISRFWCQLPNFAYV